MYRNLFKQLSLLLPALGLICCSTGSPALAQNPDSVVEDMLKEHEQNMDQFLQPSNGSQRDLDDGSAKERLEKMRRRSGSSMRGLPSRMRPQSNTRDPLKTMRAEHDAIRKRMLQPGPGGFRSGNQQIDRFRAEHNARVEQMHAETEARMNAIMNDDPFDRSSPGHPGFRHPSSSSSNYNSYSSTPPKRTRVRTYRVGRAIRGIFCLVALIIGGISAIVTGRGAGSNTGPPPEIRL